LPQGVKIHFEKQKNLKCYNDYRPYKERATVHKVIACVCVCVCVVLKLYRAWVIRDKVSKNRSEIM